MGRPPGYTVPEEEIERRNATMRETFKVRPQWSTWFAPIKRAADAGNRREAIRLLDEYIRNRRDAA
jgi:hypothetical protein